MTKVVAINGSHRKGKNTARMLQVVLDELAAKGIETELLELKDYNIINCKSCNKCLKKPECSIKDEKDDMTNVLAEKLLQADGIVLGSPVYWGNVTTLMKNFMDRTRWLHMAKNMLAGKVGAAVTHAGLRNGGQESCLAIMEHFLKAQGLHLVDNRDQDSSALLIGPIGTMFENYDGNAITWKKSVDEDFAAIESCKQLGKNMLALLNKISRE